MWFSYHQRMWIARAGLFIVVSLFVFSFLSISPANRMNSVHDLRGRLLVIRAYRDTAMDLLSMKDGGEHAKQEARRMISRCRHDVMVYNQIAGETGNLDAEGLPERLDERMCGEAK